MENDVNDKTTAASQFKDYIDVTANNDLIEAVPEAAPFVHVFNETYPLLIGALKIQAKEKHGFKTDSDLALSRLGKGLYKLGMKSSVLAEAAERFDIFEQINHPITYLTRVSMNLALGRARNWRDALNDNRVALLTNISVAEIAVVDGLISDFDTKRLKPKAEIKDGKTKGTEKIPGYIRKVGKAMESIYKLMYGEYVETEPDFVAGMSHIIHPDHTGVHHTGLLVMCSYANPPEGLEMNVISGMQIKLIENGMVAISNLYGVAVVPSAMQGGYTMECTGVDLVTKNVPVILIKGKKVRVDLEMERVV